ncbi:hypothetical protein BH20VER3_BH20VER3_03280 [soil metagenome]
MEVTPDQAAAVVERGGKKFYFCSTHCRDQFVREGKPGRVRAHSCCHGEHHLLAGLRAVAAEAV